MIKEFIERKSVHDVEEGQTLQPKFDQNNLIPVITVDISNNEILMHGYMNQEAFRLSMETKEAHYWSRSRKCIWKKGETSGLNQNIKEIKIDDSEISLVPETTVQADLDTSLKVFKLLEMLEDLDDTQNVTSNIEFAEGMLDQLD